MSKEPNVISQEVGACGVSVASAKFSSKPNTGVTVVTGSTKC